MTMVKTIQYVSISILLIIFMEGMFTLGDAFNFNKYNAFAWFAQAVIFTATITTALRIRDEEGK